MGPLHHGLGLEKRERKVGYGGDDPLSREVAIEGRSSLTRFDSGGEKDWAEVEIRSEKNGVVVFFELKML